MQIFEALAFERARLFRRIVIEDGRAAHVALGQSHALPFFEINRGKKNHGRHLIKLAIRARPSFWLFSG